MRGDPEVKQDSCWALCISGGISRRHRAGEEELLQLGESAFRKAKSSIRPDEVGCIRIAVDPENLDPVEGREQRVRVAAAAERRIDDQPAFERAKDVDNLGGHDRYVIVGDVAFL